MKYEVLCPRPPIAASLILPAIFLRSTGATICPKFFCFFLFYIVFWYFLFVILFLFFSPFYFFSFISSYPTLLISSYSSYSSRTLLRLLILLFSYLNLFVVLHAGGQAFFDSFGAIVYTCATILFFCSYLFLFFSSYLFSSYLFLFFSYYILLLLILVLQTCVLNTHLAKLHTWTA